MLVILLVALGPHLLPSFPDIREAHIACWLAVHRGEVEPGDQLLAERLFVELTSADDEDLLLIGHTRDVDGGLLGLLDDTRQTVGEYQRLEQERGRVLLEFSLFYLGFALLLVAAAMWLGLWFADRLSRPIGRLAEAEDEEE